MSSERVVLIVTNAVNGGGAEKSSVTIFNCLVERKVNAYLCAINVPTINHSDSNAERIFSLNRKWKSGLYSTISAWFRFYEIYRSLRPQTIIVNCELPELFASLLIDRRTRFIFVEHTSKPWINRRSIGFFVRLINYFKKSLWVSVVDDTKGIWPTGKRAIYIANPVPFSQTRNSRDGINRENEAMMKNLVYVGRLNKDKNVESVVKASLDLNLHLDVYGEGSLLGYLKELASKKDKLIEFHGFVANPWNQISFNHLVIVPSKFEGDGLVCLEAALNGNHLLLADNEDLRRLSFQNRHYYVDYEDMLKKVVEWKNGKLSLQLNSFERKKIIEDRDPDQVIRKWQQII